MAAKQIYQFKVTLRGIRPPIWRRFQVPSNITFQELHAIIQTVMGWYGGHLHLFDLGGFLLADPELLADWGEDGADEQKAKLNRYLTDENVKIRYEYDFGDSWDHDLLLEKILPTEPGVAYPRCLKGKRACPPEDCGGVWGYASLLEAMADPENPEHASYLEWLGEPFDPEAFDLDEVNELLDFHTKGRA